MSLEHLRERLLEGIYGCKTLDCYLVRISSLVYELEDLSRLSGNPKDYVVNSLAVIMHKTQRKLQPLACNLGTVIELIDNDPRFKTIRKYRDEFIEILNDIKCTEPQPIPVKTLAPPPSIDRSYTYHGEPYYEMPGYEQYKPSITDKLRAKLELRIKPGIHWAALLISVFLFISMFLPWYEISYTVNGKTLASAGITPIGALKYYQTGDTGEINRFTQALPTINRTAAETWAIRFLEDMRIFIYMIILAFTATGASTLYRKAGRITLFLYALILVGYPLMIAWNYGTDYIHTTANILGIDLSIGISWGYIILWAPVILYILFKD